MADVTDTTVTPGVTAAGAPATDDEAPAVASATTRRMSPDRLAELEEERRFLLRSLADLERELAAGDVDQADYEALRDGYTSRAAAVLRAIDTDRAARSPKGPRNLRRIVAITVAVLLLGAGLGVLVARFASPRGSGDTITGGTEDDRIATLLIDARAALNMSNADPRTAIDKYKAVLEIDRDNVEARTYLGWVVALTSQDLTGDAKASSLADGKELITKAIETDPTYADPYCFLAIIAAQFENDVPTAATRRAECLSHDPAADMQGLIIDYVEPLTNPPAADPDGAPGTTG